MLPFVGYDSPNGQLHLALNIPLHKFVKKVSTPERSEPSFTRLTRPPLAAVDSGLVHSELSPAGHSHGRGRP
jgi:hypothetical protein